MLLLLLLLSAALGFVPAASWQSSERAPHLTALQQQLDRLFNLPEGAWDKR
jgi:hypothetical protein